MPLFVADTHALVWHLQGKNQKLGHAAREAFRSADQGNALIHVPVPVLLEVWSLQHIGRIDLGSPFREWRLRLEAIPGFSVVPFEADQMDHLPSPDALRDPTDRLIVAIARAHGLPLITADAAITESKLVEICW